MYIYIYMIFVLISGFVTGELIGCHIEDKLIFGFIDGCLIKDIGEC